jgi:hypothetical protein
VYIAWNYWAEGQDFAIDLGFGVIKENGVDLTVDPKHRVWRCGQNMRGNFITQMNLCNVFLSSMHNVAVN